MYQHVVPDWSNTAMTTFIDRNDTTQSVEIVSAEKHANYRSIWYRYDNLRGALLKLWLDGHLGVRNCAVGINYAPLVEKSGSCGRDISDKALFNVSKPLPENIIAKLYIATGEIEEAEEILKSFVPKHKFINISKQDALPTGV